METYAPEVNWIGVRSILNISSIHELPSTYIDFVLDSTQGDLDVDVFMDHPLRMAVDGNRG